jgi:hypothetical protein
MDAMQILLTLARTLSVAAGLALAAFVTAGAQTAPTYPAEVACYVDAVNRQALDELVGCFAADAVITDVSRPIRGADAIRRWAAAEVIGGSLRVISSEAQPTGGIRCLVHWAPRGSSGWRAWYSFRIEGGRILAADLQYA